jgi:hypothetical protein
VNKSSDLLLVQERETHRGGLKSKRCERNNHGLKFVVLKALAPFYGFSQALPPTGYGSTPQKMTLVSSSVVATGSVDDFPTSTDCQMGVAAFLETGAGKNNANNGRPATKTTTTTTTGTKSTTSECATDESFQSEDSNDDNNTDGGEGGSTFWELFVTLYLPFVLVLFRKSMFGSVNLIRSIVVGQVLRLLVGYGSEWMDHNKTPNWMHGYVEQWTAMLSRLADAASSSAGPASTVASGAAAGNLLFPHGNADPQAWPQQFLTALGVLTVFALVVHPDGLTWVVLGNIR